MAKSVAPLCSSKRFPLRPRAPVSHLLTSPRRVFHPNTLFQGFNAPVSDQSERFPLEIDQSHPTDPGALCEHLVDLVSRLRPLLPASCGWLDQGSIEVVEGRPVDAGGVADILAGKMGNRKVVIKVHRCNSSSDYSVTYAVSAIRSWAM